MKETCTPVSYCFAEKTKMNPFLYIVVFVLAFSIKKQANAEELKTSHKNEMIQNVEPQIKLISYKSNRLNEKYLTLNAYEIEKHNATYNRLIKRMTVNRNVPPISSEVNVYATDKNYENFKHLLTLDIPVCSENRYRELLPKALVLPKTILKDNCFKKGEFNSDDYGVFRFEVLIPNIHEISDYYKVDINITTVDRREVIAEDTVFAEWGYLHTQ